jgi:hypothetical protein
MNPVLIEHTERSDGDGWTTEWYCDPPAWGASFQVIRDEWDGGVGGFVRKIFEIKLTEVRGST